VLAGHRGWDPGALGVARAVARKLHAPLHVNPVTRLLVEVNRSPGHPALFSEFTRGLPVAERAAIRAAHYDPYRDALTDRIREQARSRGAVLHLSIHTFTPVLDGEPRNADVGFLYDPARTRERHLGAEWRRELVARLPDLRCRRNYPYRGAADGLTTHLRRIFPAASYLGIEIEISQRYFGADGQPRPAQQSAVTAIRSALLASLDAVVPELRAL
jgi:predicted N-formylglutamate amidohydrolase